MGMLSSSERLRRLAAERLNAAQGDPFASTDQDAWGVSTVRTPNQSALPPPSDVENLATVVVRDSERRGALVSPSRPTPPKGLALGDRAPRPPTPPKGLTRPPTPTRPSGRLPAGVPGARTTSSRLGAVEPCLEPGGRLGPYELLEVIGRGSMGRVLRARDPVGRDVALKVVLPRMCDEEGRARFRREGQAMAAVPPHRNVVTVHTTGEVGGAPYLVMDFVAGEALDRLIKKGPLPVEQALEIALHMGQALEHVHRAGVLHRDLKPANVIVRAEDGEPVLTDFGMAALRGAEQLTRTGDLLGTPLYMAPEQILGQRIDRRSEVWSLGAILFEMLAGRPPFEGQTLAEVSRAITNDPVPPLRRLRPEVDAGLAQVVAGCLAKHPTDRFERPGAVAEALAAWRDGLDAPSPRRRRSWLVPLLVLVSLGSLGLAGQALWDRWQRRDEALAAPPGPASATPIPEPTPAQAPPLPEDDGLDEALDSARIALERDDPQAARVALSQPGWQLSQDDGRLAALRKQAVAAGSRLADDPLRRPGLLSLLAALARWTPRDGTPEATAEALLADRVVGQARRIEALAREPEQHETAVALLEALGASGLRPGDRSALDRLSDDLWLMTKQAEAAAHRREVVHALLWRGLLALLRLDAVPSQNALGAADLGAVPWPTGRDPLGDWLVLAARAGQRGGGTAERALGELLREKEAAFGLRALARGLVLAASAEERPAERRAMFERAVALDPTSPWARRALADSLLRARVEGELSRARELAEDALRDFDTWHADRTTTAWEQVRFQLTALEAAAQSGDRARLEELRVQVMASGRGMDDDRERWLKGMIEEAERNSSAPPARDASSAAEGER